MVIRSMKILIGGGTGFVGRHLVRCLRENGAKVQIITRKPSSPDQISWDAIRDSGLPNDTTAVVNLAGRNILEPSFWTESYKKEIYDSRIETNKLLVKAIHDSTTKPDSFVTVSGVGYYKPDENEIYDESWKQPDDESKKDYLMKLADQWEKSSELDEQLAPSTRRVVIRSGVVIGKGGGIIQNTLLPFKLGLGGPIGSGSQWFPWIHVEDLTNMFKFAITNEHVTGIINGVTQEQSRNKDFAAALGSALERPSFIPLPAFVVRLAFGSERADILLKGQCVKSRSSLIGFRYQYPTLIEACKESVK